MPTWPLSSPSWRWGWPSPTCSWTPSWWKMASPSGSPALSSPCSGAPSSSPPSSSARSAATSRTTASCTRRSSSPPAFPSSPSSCPPSSCTPRPPRAGDVAGGRLHLLLDLQSFLRAGLPLLPDRHLGLRPAVHRAPRGPLLAGGGGGLLHLRTVVASCPSAPAHQPLHRHRHREHDRLSPLPRSDVRARHRHVLRLHRHDHPAVHPRSGRQVVPTARGGDLLRLPHVRVQRGHAALRERGRPPLRQLRLHPSRSHLDHHHGGRMAARAVRPDRSHRVPGPPRRAAADLMRLLRLGLLLAGAALFVWLVVEIGPDAVVQAFRDLSWRLLVILVFPL